MSRSSTGAEPRSPGRPWRKAAAMIATVAAVRLGAARTPRPAGRQGEWRAPPDHDPHVAVRVAIQRVPVPDRPQRRPAAPRLVDHRMLLRPGRDPPAAGVPDAVPSEPLL